MHPILFELGPIPVYSYGTMIALAFLICIYLVRKDAQKIGIEPGAVTDIGLWIIVSGVVGARVTYVLMNARDYLEDPLEIIMLNHGGLVYYGGVTAGTIAAIYLIRRAGLPVLKTTDVLIPYIALGQALGRIGCFLNGCCYGRPTTTGLGITFPPESPAFLAYPGQKIIPVQLVSFAALVCLFLVLKAVSTKKRFDGQVFALYFIIYPALRFVIEFFRGDNQILFAGLTVGQLTSTGMFAIGVIMFVSLMRRKKNVPGKIC
jgi:phosphatidylglycerol:prolipoprotein diacylglycerol transferase